eukprot:CAMPEP_0172662196 /NCGR_PEP_ID=MMETSP1074-20121228/5207_1 /TAXON_ID=2916 /ORGANISM="Ceratium fusus, Strain PA161109" /LENGTH=507 /DNA_ID=CAMNT_0013478075 /DNA_START=119 /DNA_END=1643 /DNA_ORIENTATION=+
MEGDQEEQLLRRLECIKQQLLETTGEEARVHAKLRGASLSGLKAEFDANRDALFDALGMLHKVESTLQEASYGGPAAPLHTDRSIVANEFLEHLDVSPEHGICVSVGEAPDLIACRPSEICECLPSRESSARDARVSNMPVRAISAPSRTVELKLGSGSAERWQPDVGSQASQNCAVVRSNSAALPDDGQNFWESVMRVGASPAPASSRSRSSSPNRSSSTPSPSKLAGGSHVGSLRQRAEEIVPWCLTAKQQEVTEHPRQLRRRASPGRILGHRGCYQPTSPTATTAGTGMRQARPPPCTLSVVRQEQHPPDTGSIPTKDLRSHSGPRAAHSGSSVEFDTWSETGNSIHSRSGGASQSAALVGPSSDCSNAEQHTARHLEVTQRPRWAEILAEVDMMSAAFGVDHEQQTESSHARSSKQLVHDAAAPPGPPLLLRERSLSGERLRSAAVFGDRCNISPQRSVGLVVSSTLPDKDAQVRSGGVAYVAQVACVACAVCVVIGGQQGFP